MRETPIIFKSEGQQVIGMLHRPSGRGPVPAVVFLHGFTGSKVESHRLFVEQARALAQAGVAVLRFDFRGSGDSAGEFSQMTIAGERADAQAALRWLRRQAGIDRKRIGLLGMSLGGMVAAFTLADDAGIRAAALWNPVAFPRELRDRRATAESSAQLRELGVVDSGGWAVGAPFLEELGVLDPVAAIRTVRAPVLIVVGTEDETVPYAHGAAYRDALRAAGAPCALHAVIGAGHTFASLPWKTEAIAVTLAWFREQLA